MILQFPRKNDILAFGLKMPENMYTQQGLAAATVGSPAQSLTSGSTHSADVEMSIVIMSAVWQLNIPTTEKLVLLAIADHADDEALCWPSVPLIASKCCLSDRQVQRLIKSLVKRNYLKVIRRKYQSNYYQVMVTPVSRTGDNHVTLNHQEPSEHEKCSPRKCKVWHEHCTAIKPPVIMGISKRKRK